MILKNLKPKKALNKAYLKIKPHRNEIEQFKSHLLTLLNSINERETEEFHKNLVIDFLKKTYYDPNYFINTKGRNDLVIHNGKSAKSTVGVIIEAKSPTNKYEMITTENLNRKAFQELVLYYLRERITHKNLEIKHLVATNINEWFIFNATTFDRLFTQNKSLVKQFKDFEENRLAETKTDFFYNEIASPFIEQIKMEIEFTYFNFQDYQKPLRNDNKRDDNKLIALFKLLSPEHLLKLPFANDSNSLDKRFYSELLHIIGLSETKEGGKKLIERSDEKNRNTGSILESTIIQLESLDIVSRLKKANQFGSNTKERTFNVALELVITWINRVLFLKLMEAQLIKYNYGNPDFAFLNSEKLQNYDDLNSLFFQVLAREAKDRNDEIKKDFANVPYLNSSLFEPTEIERDTLYISNLRDDKTIPVFAQTVLKDSNGKRRKGELTTLQYLFQFLNAYDFGNEGSEEIQEDNKTLINASVLGLIFEKINGYKDGSFFTPGFITMYMARETIRKTVIQKFNEIKDWNCTTIPEIYNKIDNINEANEIINSIKLLDPAVGSGHFLVSSLNEMIAVKNDLKILQDKNGLRLKEYQVEVVNDELIVTDEDGELFEYHPTNKESQRIQETLFREKQTIIENCLFGVDINSNSVKICRLRLWIELLKNAYYKNETELETLPNIDINIKNGNSLISRFDLDSDLKKALKNSKWNIDSYRLAVASYRNAKNKDHKREMEQLIDEIKSDFRSEINNNDPKKNRLSKLAYELYNRFTGNTLFVLEPTTPYGKGNTEDKLKKQREVEQCKIENEIAKLRKEIDEIEGNKIYENAFEWRFEFPEVLNDDGDFVGFDAVIANPPYIQLSKTKGITKEYKTYLKDRYDTSGGRLNTFIFFIHLAQKLLKTNGILHFIIPNTILSQEYYSFTRQSLINEVSLTEIVNFPILPFEDAVVETVLIQFINSKSIDNEIPVKELTEKEIKTISYLNPETVKRTLKFSFAYQLDPIIEKIYLQPHKTFGQVCDINQGIALKGDKTLSLVNEKINNKSYKLLDGRNINKFQVDWDGIWLDYDLKRIHSCKQKDIFESEEKLMFRRVSSSLIFTYDDNQYFALNTLVIVNKKNPEVGPDLKFILGLMNSTLMNYVYKNKFKSTKKVFSEIQARSIKQLPIPKVTNEIEKAISDISDKAIQLKKQSPESDITELETKIDKLVYELYELTEEEIEIIENSL